jgi:hypothetical protein
MTPKMRRVSVAQTTGFIHFSGVPTAAGREVLALPIAAHLAG